MNKRQFEEIEGKIREAAENVSPPFNEEDWEAMNVLLNKEFPEKKRRKIFFWLLPLAGLLVAGGIYFSSPVTKSGHQIAGTGSVIDTNAVDNTISHNHGTDHPVTDNHTGTNNLTEHPSVKNAAKKDIVIVNGPVTDPGNMADKNKGNAIENSNTENPFNTGSGHKRLRTGKTSVLSGNTASGKETGSLNDQPLTTLKQLQEQSGPQLDNKKETQTTGNDLKNNTKQVKAGLQAIVKDSTGNKNIVATAEGDTVLKAQESKIIAKKLSPVRSGGFYLIAAGSFANSSTGVAPSGKVSEEYGLGIGYRISRKLSVQTGFYAGKKKYSADRDDYYFPPGSYFWDIKNLKIDADCYVFEIPVTVKYNVIQKEKYSIYGTAGISSYIMKKEDYVYSYTKDGTVHRFAKAYTGNDHLFSIAGISAGYERKLTHTISALVEPYLKIPLSGVGEGKVKLHSSGILLGIKYNLHSNRK